MATALCWPRPHDFIGQRPGSVSSTGPCSSGCGRARAVVTWGESRPREIAGQHSVPIRDGPHTRTGRGAAAHPALGRASTWGFCDEGGCVEDLT